MRSTIATCARSPRKSLASGTMLDEDEPTSLARVTEALHPCTIVRSRKRKRVRAEEGAVEGDDVLADDFEGPVEDVEMEVPEPGLSELPTS